jgi:hypothetical protein
MIKPFSVSVLSPDDAGEATKSVALHNLGNPSTAIALNVLAVEQKDIFGEFAEYSLEYEG